MKSEAVETGYNPALDVIRLAAAGLVFWQHLLVGGVRSGPLTPFQAQGRLGVYVFFALSGYLVFRPFVHGRTDVGTYYRRRVARIIPAYLLALVGLTLLLGVPPDALRLLTFTQGWGSPQPQPGFSVTWTLSAEVFFYVILPVLAFALRGWQPRVVLTLVAVALLSYVATGYPYRQDDVWLLLWGFAPGMLVAILEDKVRGRRWLLAAGVVAAIAALRWHVPALMSIAAAMAIAGSLDMQFHLPALRTLADASYAFYLWHLAIVLTLVAAGVSGFPFVLAALGFTLAIAVASLRLVELPARRILAGAAPIRSAVSRWPQAPPLPAEARAE